LYAAPTELGFQLEVLNREAIAREIKNTPQLFPFRYALLSALECGEGKFVESLPQQIRERLTRPLQEVINETLLLNQTDLRERVQRYIQATGVEPGGSRVMAEYRRGGGTTGLPRVNALVRYLVEGLGIPMKWSLDFHSRFYSFNDKGNGLDTLKPYLLQELFTPQESASIRNAVSPCEFYHDQSLSILNKTL
jgi:hypothetical protein